MAEEAEIQELLAIEDLRESAPAPAPASKYADVIASASLCVRRDCLVLDAALGGRDAWDTELTSSAVDFAEERDADGRATGRGWAASVSVIFSLFSLQDGGTITSTHMHDETGSGQSEGQPSRARAIECAEGKAIESARRRLAKRFALSIDTKLLAAIEAQVGKGQVGQLAAMRGKRKWQHPPAAGAPRR